MKSFEALMYFDTTKLCAIQWLNENKIWAKMIITCAVVFKQNIEWFWRFIERSIPQYILKSMVITVKKINAKWSYLARLCSSRTSNGSSFIQKFGFMTYFKATIYVSILTHSLKSCTVLSHLLLIFLATITCPTLLQKV